MDRVEKLADDLDPWIQLHFPRLNIKLYSRETTHGKQLETDSTNHRRLSIQTHEVFEMPSFGLAVLMSIGVNSVEGSWSDHKGKGVLQIDNLFN